VAEIISFDGRLGVIRVVSSGAITLDEWNRSLERIAELSKVWDCNNVLVDISRQTTIPAIVDLYEFGAMLPRDYRYALVTSAEIPDGHLFLETVGANRGKIIGFFGNEEQALAWFAAFT